MECYLNFIKILKGRYPHIKHYPNLQYITWYELYWGVKNKWTLYDITVYFNHNTSFKLKKNHYLVITWDYLSEPLYYLINSFEIGILDSDHLPIKFEYNNKTYKFKKIYDILDVLNKDCNSLTIFFKNDTDLLYNSYCVPVVESDIFTAHISDIDDYLQSNIYKRN